jgi:hypothetical protein
MIVLTFVTLAVGVEGLLTVPVLSAMLIVSAMLTLLHFVKQFRRAGGFLLLPIVHHSLARVRASPWRRWPWPVIALTVVLLGYLYIALLGALSPEVGFDARWNHLAVAVHYAQRGRFFDIVKENRHIWAAWSTYQEVLYTLFVKLWGPLAAKLLHWGDTVITALLFIAFCRWHFRSATMGLIAALVFISTPLVTWATSTANDDLPLAFYGLLTVHLLLRWRQERTWQRLLLLGVIAGYPLGVKTVDVVTLPVLGLAMAFFIWRDTVVCSLAALAGVASRAAAIFGFGLVLGFLPAMLRVYSMTGNPVYPLLDGLFHSPYWSAEATANDLAAFSRFHPDYSWWSLLTLPWGSVVAADTHRALMGPLYLYALPFVLLAAYVGTGRNSALLRVLGAFVLAWTLTWFPTKLPETRYLMPELPVMALLVAFPLTMAPWSAWLRPTAQRITWLGFVALLGLNLQLLVPLQRHANDLYVYAGRAPVDWGYLYGTRPDYPISSIVPPLVQYTNQHLSWQKDKIYDDEALVDFYLYSKIEIYSGLSYNFTVHQGRDDLCMPNALRWLRQRGITHIATLLQHTLRFKQCALGKHIREVQRFYNGEVLYRISYPNPGAISE